MLGGRSRRWGLLGGLVAGWAVGSAAHAEPPVVSGFVAVTGGAFEAERSWQRGGVGKLGSGGEASGEQRRDVAVGEARLAVDWALGANWRVHLQGGGRAEQAVPDAREAGLIELYLEGTWGFGEGHQVRVRGGQFFLPSSRENVDPLWTSPYTLTLSAWNSWIAEEVRPAGVELGYQKFGATGHELWASGTVFAGNDPSGVLLAFRGFALHDRVTPHRSFLPLPALDSLDGIFSAQNERGTRPVGSELDDRVGLAGQLGWRAPNGRAQVQLTGYDSRGDRLLHGDQYAWRTRFAVLGAEAELGRGVAVVGEWAAGDTSMGPSTEARGRPFNVFAPFEAGYLMGTWSRSGSRSGWRVSVRHDRFEVREEDFSPRAEDNDETGSAWTLALLWSAPRGFRLGLEGLEVDAARDEVPGGRAANLDGRSLKAELRWSF